MIRAAGGVVTRRGAGGELEVAVIHRVPHDDWTLPKGKLERDETDEACALREVEEETGLRCRLGRPLGTTRYRVGGCPKAIRWFSMEPVEGELGTGDGVDAARWVTLEEARALLTHRRDRDVVARL